MFLGVFVLTMCLGLPACLYACVLIHGVKGVVVKGVTLTHTVSYRPGEAVFIKQELSSNTQFNTADNRADTIQTAR